MSELRVVAQHVPRSFGADAPPRQHVPPPAQAERLARILLDEQDAEPARIDLAHAIEHEALERGGQGGRGLVEEQQARLHHQRHRDREHLALAARQSARPRAPPSREDREELDDGPHSLVERTACRPRADRQVLPHAERREHVGLLGHVAEAALDDTPRTGFGDVGAAQHDPAPARPHEARQRLQQGRFSGAVGSDDGDQLAGLDAQRETAEDLVVAVAGREVTHLEERGHAAVPRYASSTRGSRRTSANGPSRRVRPWAITITGSQSSVTRSMSCSMRRNVRPAARSARIASTSERISVGFKPARASPSRISPPSAGVRPLITLKSVVLPAPFGPMRPVIEPSRTESVHPASASTPPKRLVIPVTESSGVVADLPWLRIIRQTRRERQCEPVVGFHGTVVPFALHSGKKEQAMTDRPDLVIDGDGHVIEVDATYERIDPQYRERRPRYTQAGRGYIVRLVDGKVWSPETDIGFVGVNGNLPPPKGKAIHYRRMGTYNPWARLADMDRDQIDVAEIG